MIGELVVAVAIDRSIQENIIQGEKIKNGES